MDSTFHNKIYSILLLLLFFLVETSHVHSQTWDKTLGGSGDENSQKILKEGGFFYLVGYGTSFTSSRANGLVVKVDSLGNRIWATSFGSERRETVITAIWDSLSRNLSICGHITSSATSGADDFMKVTLDEYGNYVGKSFMGNSGDEHLFSASINQTGDILANGNGYNSSYNSRMGLWDSLGNISWMKSFDFGGAGSEAIYRSWANGNDFILVGMAGGVWGVTSERDPVLMKMDVIGNIIFAKKYRTQGSEIHAKRGCRSHSGGTIIMDVKKVSGTSQIILFEVNSSGGVIWGKTYSSPNSLSAVEVVSLEKEGYILAGSIIAGSPNNSDAILIRLDTLGNKIWAHGYGGNLSEKFTDVVSINTGFVGFGTSNSFSSNGDLDFYLVQTDANGYLNSACFSSNIPIMVTPASIPSGPLSVSSSSWNGSTNWTMSAVSRTSQISPQFTPCTVLAQVKDLVFDSRTEKIAQLKAYPNPTSDFLQLESSGATYLQVRLIDPAGRLLLSQFYPENNHLVRLDLSAIPQGIYFLEWDNGVDIGVKKVVRK